MKLKELKIELQPAYSDNAGKYEGTIEYQDVKGTTHLVLDTEISEKILGFIGPVLTAAALRVHKELESNLQASLTEAQKNIVLEIAQ